MYNELYSLTNYKSSTIKSIRLVAALNVFTTQNGSRTAFQANQRHSRIVHASYVQ